MRPRGTLWILPLAVLGTGLVRAGELKVGLPGAGKDEPAHVVWKVRVEPESVPQGGTATIVAAYETAKGWHLYAPDHKATGTPTRIEIGAAEGLRADGSPTFPEPEVKVDPILEETQRLLSGKGEVRQKVAIAADAKQGATAIPVVVHHMTCSDTVCDPPSEEKVRLTLTVTAAAPEPASEPGPEPAPAPTPPETPEAEPARAKGAPEPPMDATPAAEPAETAEPEGEGAPADPARPAPATDPAKTSEPAAGSTEPPPAPPLLSGAEAPHVPGAEDSAPEAKAPAAGPAAETTEPAGKPDAGARPGVGAGATFRRAHVSWTLTLDPPSLPRGGSGALVASYDLAKGWHLYAPDHRSEMGLGLATKVTLDSGVLEAEGAPSFPQPIEASGDATLGETHRYLEGKAAVRVPVRVARDAAPGKHPVKVRIDFMTCDAQTCDPPDSIEASLDVDVLPGAAAEAPAAGEPGAAQAAPPRDGPRAPVRKDFIADAGLLVFVLAMIAGGLIALIMPCTYPMIPITISYFTKQAEKRNGRILPLALAYGAGIILIFVAIGWLFAGSIGPFAAEPLVNLIFGLAFAVFALSLFGLFEIRLPAFVNALASKAAAAAASALSRAVRRGPGPAGGGPAGSAAGPGPGVPVSTAPAAGAGRRSDAALGYLGVLLLGATLVVTSFTCTAPILGSLLAFAVQGGGMGRVTLGMTVFGATMALPFVLLALFPARVRKLPRSGEWMHTLKVSLGFLELAAALKFFSNAEFNWELMVLPREVFLILCVAIFAVWALYLLGVFRLKGEAHEGISGIRMVIGTGVACVAAYLFLGVLGFSLDVVTEALAPPYHAARDGGSNGGGGAAGPDAGAPGSEEPWALVEDDLEAGLAKARAEGKRALLNFTGITCVNCRAMERKVFPRPEVLAELRKYVEVRLHTDKVANAEVRARSQRFQEYKVRLTGSQGNPMYVVVDPGRPEEAIEVFGGADLPGGGRFREFLERNART